MIDTSLRRGHVPSDDETRARRARNLAIAYALAGLVALFYVTTLAKLGLHLPGL
jgi:hypothetical protein